MDVGSPVAGFWLNVINEGGFATGAGTVLVYVMKVMLASLACVSGLGRKKMMVRFIGVSDLLKLAHLKHADHPPGRRRKLSNEELEVVWELRHMARNRSR